MNSELARKIVEKITADPASYDQETWGTYKKLEGTGECGTVCCVAGHACVLSGWELVNSNGKTGAEMFAQYGLGYWWLTECARPSPSSDSRPVSYAGQELLGISSDV